MARYSRPTGIRAVNSKAQHSTFLTDRFPEMIVNNRINYQRINNIFKN